MEFYSLTVEEMKDEKIHEMGSDSEMNTQRTNKRAPEHTRMSQTE